MRIEYPAFGRIVVDGTEYDHDVVVENGHVRKRDKGPSRSREAPHGHTPLTLDEAIPWSQPTLIIGSGHSGRLPVLADVEEESARRGVELVVIATSQAVDLLNRSSIGEVNAILHVTC